MSDSSSTPWFASGPPEVALPDGTTLTVSQVDGGTVAILSGRVRVATRHGWTRGSRPLDHEVEPGVWLVRRFAQKMADDQGGPVDLAIALLLPGTQLESLTWSPAGAGGFPVRAGDFLGEADLDLTVGRGPNRLEYPLGGVLSPVDDEVVDDERPLLVCDRGPVGRLVPDATVEVFQGAPFSRPMPGHDLGSTRVWIGTDARGEVAAIVSDILIAYLVAKPTVWSPDVWGFQLPHSSRSARLLTDSAGSLRQEFADVTLALSLQHADGCWISQVGRLEGRLLTARAMPWFLKHPEDDAPLEDLVELPIEAYGPAVVFGLPGTYDFGVLVRFSNESPTAWAYLPRPDTFTPSIVTDAFASRYSEDEHARAAFADACMRVPAPEPGSVALPVRDDDLGPHSWLIGLDAAGDVAALFICHNPDEVVFSARPPELDEPTLRRIRTGALRNPDEAEEFELQVRDLSLEIADDGGKVMPEVRGRMHFIAETFLEPE
ncbi:hypothetical protein KLP28_13435 [Nocardioidaceae bacterium]|nr:hypothetical protein KLP28_13435 [Nocardioidaceae bacterium]